MKPRKNPKYDLQRRRVLFLSIGLCISLGLTLTAFEYAVPMAEAPPILPPVDPFEEVILEIPQTRHKEPKPAKRPKVVIQPVVVTTTEAITEEIKSVFEPTENDEPQDFVDGVDYGEDDIPIEVIEEAPINWAEKMPVPEGGMAAFYKYLKKHLKYPSQARRMGIEGKVFVRFVVDKNGEVSRLSIMKGIGAGCDVEASRVIQNYPSWEPGRQGNRSVAVWMVMPIHFKLNK
ncbi:MAG: TonB family protein [Bacteroidota bacterium]